MIFRNLKAILSMDEKSKNILPKISLLKIFESKNFEKGIYHLECSKDSENEPFSIEILKWLKFATDKSMYWHVFIYFRNESPLRFNFHPKNSFDTFRTNWSKSVRAHLIWEIERICSNQKKQKRIQFLSMNTRIG